MRDKLEVDEKLLTAAVRAGKHKSKSEAVNAALTEYVKHLKRRSLLDLFGKIDFHDDFLAEQDAKRGSLRRRKRSA